MAMYWVTGLHFRYHGRGFNIPEVLRGEAEAADPRAKPGGW